MPGSQPLPAGERYTVISADCHGGADIRDYRAYLPSRLHQAFDEWEAAYTVPWTEQVGEEGSRNWDHDRRLAELAADGIVAEVLFPNTIPPFYPEPSLKAQQPGASEGDLALRWEGLRAHNRWLADFSHDSGGRRKGLVQIMLHDPQAAAAEVAWAAEAGMTAGILLPGAPPGSGLEPLYSRAYDPLWRACEEAGLPVTHHSGSAVPTLGEEPVDSVTFMLEVTWWAHRALWHLIFGGVMERFPTLRFVFTEQGTAWIPETLGTLDYFFHRMSNTVGSQEYEWGHPVVSGLSLPPSGYWARQCAVGASFIRPAEAALRHAVGVERILWGSDYPHKESSFPFSREALRASFAGVDPAEVAAMVGGNAARVYGFDLEALAPLAAAVGPTVAEIARPLPPEDIPPESFRCPAFAGLT